MSVAICTDDLWSFILYSTRYMVGRASSGVSWMSARIRAHAGSLTADQRAQLVREVRCELRAAEFGGKTLGHECDHREWAALAEWLEARA